LLAANSPVVIAHPKAVGVFFSDYDNTSAGVAALNGLPTIKMPDGTPYWSAAVSEYGVGPLTILPPVMLSEAAPTTNPDPQTEVTNWLSSESGLANVDADTIVVVFYPNKTPISMSCAAQAIGFGGYHADVMTNKGDIPYAVLSECANFGDVGPALDMVTIAASHEIIEAVTDPYQTGWVAVDNTTPAGFAWHALLAGNEENGDMCAINDGFGRPGGSYPYLLQRGWSNKAAAAGNLDPCQPALPTATQPFVGAYPVMPDMVSANGGTGPGAIIPVGSSKTVDVNCFTFQPTAPFQVGARQRRGVMPPQLTFAWENNKTTCVNGETLHLTITASSADSSGFEPFMIYAQVPGAQDPQRVVWAGVVTQM
jgi:hypothetical protein